MKNVLSKKILLQNPYITNEKQCLHPFYRKHPPHFYKKNPFYYFLKTLES